MVRVRERWKFLRTLPSSEFLSILTFRLVWPSNNRTGLKSHRAAAAFLSKPTEKRKGRMIRGPQSLWRNKPNELIFILIKERPSLNGRLFFQFVCPKLEKKRNNMTENNHKGVVMSCEMHAHTWLGTRERNIAISRDGETKCRSSSQYAILWAALNILCWRSIGDIFSHSLFPIWKKKEGQSSCRADDRKWACCALTKKEKKNTHAHTLGFPSLSTRWLHLRQSWNWISREDWAIDAVESQWFRRFIWKIFELFSVTSCYFFLSALEEREKKRHSGSGGAKKAISRINTKWVEWAWKI